MIKKREYNKAVKVVAEYEKQQIKQPNTKGMYGFLYWIEESSEDRNKYIKAKNLESAIKQFLRLKPKTLREIDCEVSLPNGGYVEIVNRPEFKEWF